MKYRSKGEKEILCKKILQKVHSCSLYYEIVPFRCKNDHTWCYGYGVYFNSRENLYEECDHYVPFMLIKEKKY